MRAFAYGDAASRAAITPQLAADRGFWLTLSVWYVSVIGRDVEGGRALARYLVDARRPPEQRGFGHIVLAHLALARGRWREARAELRLARDQTPIDALEYELLLELAPFHQPDTADVSHTLNVLARTSAQPTDASAAMSWAHTQGALRPLTRAYLTGLVAAEHGDDVARGRALAALASLPDPTGPAAIAQGFSFGIRAEREQVRGHPAAALALLERAARPTPFVAAWTSGFVSQARERYLRAELLHTLGRDDEALRWYGTFAENSPYDLVYLAPSLYRQGQIYDARGETGLAEGRYARLVALWKDCDPEFRAVTEDARRRMAVLGRLPDVPGTR
jgi:tetratricopeptide (TPR) repeat protein